MQHYAVPTRLLDWSENPLAALFFAVKPAEGTDSLDAAVWQLEPIALHKVALRPSEPANLPRLDKEDDRLEFYKPAGFTTSTPSQNLPQCPAVPHRLFPRLVAQAGAFTIAQSGSAALEAEATAHEFLGKYVIPSAAKAAMRKELALIGMTEMALFPELPSVARVVLEDALR